MNIKVKTYFWNLRMKRVQKEEYELGYKIGEALRGFLKPDVDLLDIVDNRWIVYEVMTAHDGAYFQGLGDGFGREEWDNLGNRMIEKVKEHES